MIDATNNNPSVRSHFEVGKGGVNTRGLRVRLTFTFTTGGLAVPLYVSVGGLTKEELSPELCPSGVLAIKVPGLCKGENNVNNTGIGMLIFLRGNKKDPSNKSNVPHLTITNNKCIHYNNDVLFHFIWSICESLGWKHNQPIPR